jgi:hypothetical protein
LTKAKKSISSFKIREGMIIGASVTLRGERMYDFLKNWLIFHLPESGISAASAKKCVDNDRKYHHWIQGAFGLSLRSGQMKWIVRFRIGSKHTTTAKTGKKVWNYSGRWDFRLRKRKIIQLI